MCLFTRQVPFSVGHEDMVECGAAFSAAGQAGKPASHWMNWCSHEDLHLEPPPSHGGVHCSYTLRALENGAACRNAMRDSAILNAKPFGVAEGNPPT